MIYWVDLADEKALSLPSRVGIGAKYKGSGSIVVSGGGEGWKRYPLMRGLMLMIYLMPLLAQCKGYKLDAQLADPSTP